MFKLCLACMLIFQVNAYSDFFAPGPEIDEKEPALNSTEVEEKSFEASLHDEVPQSVFTQEIEAPKKVNYVPKNGPNCNCLNQIIPGKDGSHFYKCLLRSGVLRPIKFICEKGFAFDRKQKTCKKVHGGGYLIYTMYDKRCPKNHVGLIPHPDKKKNTLYIQCEKWGLYILKCYKYHEYSSCNKSCVPIKLPTVLIEDDSKGKMKPIHCEKVGKIYKHKNIVGKCHYDCIQGDWKFELKILCYNCDGASIEDNKNLVKTKTIKEHEFIEGEIGIDKEESTDEIIRSVNSKSWDLDDNISNDKNINSNSEENIEIKKEGTHKVINDERLGKSSKSREDKIEEISEEIKNSNESKSGDLNEASVEEDISIKKKKESKYLDASDSEEGIEEKSIIKDKRITVGNQRGINHQSNESQENKDNNEDISDEIKSKDVSNEEDDTITKIKKKKDLDASNSEEEVKDHSSESQEYEGKTDKNEKNSEEITSGSSEDNHDASVTISKKETNTKTKKDLDGSNSDEDNEEKITKTSEESKNIVDKHQEVHDHQSNESQESEDESLEEDKSQEIDNKGASEDLKEIAISKKERIKNESKDLYGSISEEDQSDEFQEIEEKSGKIISKNLEEDDNDEIYKKETVTKTKEVLKYDSKKFADYSSESSEFDGSKDTSGFLCSCEGNYRFKNSCTKYYKCTKNEDGDLQMLKVERCPSCLKFNAAKHKCDFPENVSECYLNDDSSNRFCTGGGDYPIPFIPNKYYHCQDKGTGKIKLTVKSCPPGTNFNPYLSYCVQGYISKQKKPRCKLPGGYVIDNYNCGKAHHCDINNEIVSVSSCPNGMVYDTLHPHCRRLTCAPKIKTDLFLKHNTTLKCTGEAFIRKTALLREAQEKSNEAKLLEDMINSPNLEEDDNDEISKMQSNEFQEIDDKGASEEITSEDLKEDNIDEEISKEETIKEIKESKDLYGSNIEEEIEENKKKIKEIITDNESEINDDQRNESQEIDRESKEIRISKDLEENDNDEINKKETDTRTKEELKYESNEFADYSSESSEFDGSKDTSGFLCSCEGKYRFKNSCTKYYKCTKNEDGDLQMLKVERCPSCLKFNAAKHKCDFPENVSECYLNDDSPNRFCTGGGDYPIPFIPNKYYHCQDNGTGKIKLTVKSCPPGTNFNPYLSYCVQGYISKQKKPRCKLPGGYVIDNYNCGKAHHCDLNNEIVSVSSCPNGMIYDTLHAHCRRLTCAPKIKTDLFLKHNTTLKCTGEAFIRKAALLREAQEKSKEAKLLEEMINSPNLEEDANEEISKMQSNESQEIDDKGASEEITSEDMKEDNINEEIAISKEETIKEIKELKDLYGSNIEEEIEENTKKIKEIITDNESEINDDQRNESQEIDRESKEIRISKDLEENDNDEINKKETDTRTKEELKYESNEFADYSSKSSEFDGSKDTSGFLCSCEGKYRFKNSCTKYYKCTKNEDGDLQMLKVERCPSCLKFNAAKHKCDFPENVSECYLNDDSPNRFCTGGGDYPIPFIPNKYYHCQDNGTGKIKLTVKSCPPGTNFNPYLSYCVQGYISKQKKPRCKLPGGYVIDNFNCGKAHHCDLNNEIVSVSSCPNGMVYDTLHPHCRRLTCAPRIKTELFLKHNTTIKCTGEAFIRNTALLREAQEKSKEDIINSPNLEEDSDDEINKKEEDNQQEDNQQEDDHQQEDNQQEDDHQSNESHEHKDENEEISQEIISEHLHEETITNTRKGLDVNNSEEDIEGEISKTIIEDHEDKKSEENPTKSEDSDEDITVIKKDKTRKSKILDNNSEKEIKVTEENEEETILSNDDEIEDFRVHGSNLHEIRKQITKQEENIRRKSKDLDESNSSKEFKGTKLKTSLEEIQKEKAEKEKMLRNIIKSLNSKTNELNKIKKSKESIEISRINQIEKEKMLKNIIKSLNSKNQELEKLRKSKEETIDKIKKEKMLEDIIKSLNAKTKDENNSDEEEINITIKTKANKKGDTKKSNERKEKMLQEIIKSLNSKKSKESNEKAKKEKILHEIINSINSEQSSKNKKLKESIEKAKKEKMLQDIIKSIKSKSDEAIIKKTGLKYNSNEFTDYSLESSEFDGSKDTSGFLCSCEGKYRFKNSCTKYYKCTKNKDGDLQMLKVERCPSCLKFNAAKHKCDFPENVSECYLNDDSPNRFCTGGGDYPIPFIPNKYYHCQDNGTGKIKLTVKSCPPGTNFNPYLSYCVQGYKSKQKKPRCKLPRGYVIDNFNCGKAHHCDLNNEIVSVSSCPNGMVYDTLHPHCRRLTCALKIKTDLFLKHNTTLKCTGEAFIRKAALLREAQEKSKEEKLLQDLIKSLNSKSEESSHKTKISKEKAEKEAMLQDIIKSIKSKSEENNLRTIKNTVKVLKHNSKEFADYSSESSEFDGSKDASGFLCSCEGKYRFKNSCTKYYKCTKNEYGDLQMLKVERCPSCLKFNAAKHKCDFPENVSECYLNDDSPTRFCTGGGDYPIPFVPNKYYHCQDNGTGKIKLTVKSCPPGTNFNPYLSYCVQGYKSKQKKPRCKLPGGYVIDNFNCGKAHHCDLNNEIVGDSSCSNSMVYDTLHPHCRRLTCAPRIKTDLFLKHNTTLKCTGEAFIRRAALLREGQGKSNELNQAFMRQHALQAVV